MELRQLRYLLATVEAGTVSGAAERLHITQPGLSRQLRRLEKDLGVELFDRANQRLTLNRTGHELLPLVRDVLAATEALRESAGFHAGGGIRRLTIAAPTVTLTDIVSPFVATMSPDDPVVDVRPADGLAPTEMLANGADLAIGTRRPQAPYASRDLAALPMWAYVRRDDPWSKRSHVGVAELLGRTVIGVPASFTAREALESAVSRLENPSPTSSRRRTAPLRRLSPPPAGASPSSPTTRVTSWSPLPSTTARRLAIRLMLPGTPAGSARRRWPRSPGAWPTG